MGQSKNIKNQDDQKIKEMITTFLDVFDFVKQEDVYDFDQKVSIAHQYKEVQSILKQRGYTSEKLEKILDEKSLEKLHVMDFFSGTEAGWNKLYESFFVDKKNQQAHDRIINFIKSREGFDLINRFVSKNKQELSDEELVDLFGNLWGVKLMTETVKSLRTERLSNILAYALSGRFEEDLKSFIKNEPNGHAGDFGIFLQQSIQSNRKNIAASIKDLGANQIEVVFNIEDNLLETDKYAPARRIDAAFLENNTLTMGQASTHDTLEWQTNFGDQYRAAKIMSQTRELEEGKNPLYKMKVNAFIMVNALVSPDENTRLNKDGTVSEQEHHRDLKKFVQLAGTRSTEQKQKECIKKYFDVINQFHYSTLLSNVPNALQSEAFFNHNPFIVGVDTLKMHNQFNEIAKAFEQDPKLGLEKGLAWQTSNLKQMGDLIKDALQKDILAMQLKDASMQTNVGAKSSLQRKLLERWGNSVASLAQAFPINLSPEDHSKMITPLQRQAKSIMKLVDQFNFQSQSVATLKQALNIQKSTTLGAWSNEYMQYIKEQPAIKVKAVLPEQMVKKSIKAKM